jgi:predicted nucleic acid-binding Zn ribbon protein
LHPLKTNTLSRRTLGLTQACFGLFVPGLFGFLFDCYSPAVSPGYRGGLGMVPHWADCSFCNAKLSMQKQVLRARFCGEPCRVKYARLAPHQLCLVCGRALSPAQYRLRACATPACVIEANVRREDEERRKRAEREAKELALRDQLAGPAGVEEPETYRVIQIPHVRLPATKPSEQRLLKLRDFLNGLISKLEVGDSGPKADGPGFDSGVRADFTPNTEVLAILNTACGLCQGYCCQRGGLHHAFLSIETIRRYMSRHPGLRPADVRDI